MDEQEQTTQRVTETTVAGGRRNDDVEPARLEPCLVILSGRDRGRSIRLIRGRNSFGRGRDADIVLVDPKLSRLHGAFLVDGDRIELVDLGSTNGLFLDSAPVERAMVGPNARINAGDIVMKVEFKHPTELDAERSLYEAANTDPLTGALNRRAFMTRAEQEVVHALRNGHFLSILLCDIDHFKRINDGHGHPAGDQVLKELTNILRSHIRRDDLLARFGGEEFIVLLRNIDDRAAAAWGERIRHAIEQQRFEFDGRQIPVTLSMGVKSAQVLDTALLDRMIQDADAALYRAKQGGRNRVVLDGPTGD